MLDVTISHPAYALARAQEICDARLKEAQSRRLTRKTKEGRFRLQSRLLRSVSDALGSFGLWLVVEAIFFSLVLFWRAKDLSQRLLRHRQDPVLRGYQLSETS